MSLPPPAIYPEYLTLMSYWGPVYRIAVAPPPPALADSLELSASPTPARYVLYDFIDYVAEFTYRLPGGKTAIMPVYIYRRRDTVK